MTLYLWLKSVSCSVCRVWGSPHWRRLITVEMPLWRHLCLAALWRRSWRGRVSSSLTGNCPGCRCSSLSVFWLWVELRRRASLGGTHCQANARLHWTDIYFAGPCLPWGLPLFLWHWFNKVLERLGPYCHDSIMQLSAAHLWCDFPIPAHPKAAELPCLARNTIQSQSNWLKVAQCLIKISPLASKKTSPKLAWCLIKINPIAGQN